MTKTDTGTYYYSIYSISSCCLRSNVSHTMHHPSFSASLVTLCSFLLSNSDAFVPAPQHHYIQQNNNIREQQLDDTPLLSARYPTLLSAKVLIDELLSDDFPLFGGDNKRMNKEMEKAGLTGGALLAYEMFVGQVVFSGKADHPRIGIAENYDLMVDPQWVKWLERKISSTRDVGEADKMAMENLLDMIVDVKEGVERAEPSRTGRRKSK